MIKYQCSGWLKYKKGSSDLRGFTYTYDASGNITKIVTEGTNVPQAALTKEYTYDALGQLATEVNGSGTTFGYAYDTAGNIRNITKDGTVTKSFGYTNPSWPDLLTSVTSGSTTKDILYEGQSQTSDLPSSGNPVTYYNGRDYTFTWTKGRQLASATVDGKQISYAYDTVGNIRSVTTDGAVTKSFGYTNASWPDLLTSVTANGTTKDVLYEGQSQTSDLPSSGNPITYYNGKDYTFTWTKGRQLTEATVDGEQVSYTYDMSGVRSNKQVGDTTYTYTTLSGKVMRQTWGDNNALEFVYDDGNQPFAVIYKHGQTTELYYYVLNAQGDVSAILDSGGKIAASYDYDAWGNCTVYNSSDAAIGDLNPLRYRGYYYDAETGFYYLQSRYYDPAICRFINADTYLSTGQGMLGHNMFTYCGNNPVNYCDSSGRFFFTLLGAMIGAAAGYIDAFIAGEDPIKGAIAGGVSGAIAGAGVDIGVIITVSTGGAGIGWGFAAAVGLGAAGAAIGTAISNDWKMKKDGESLALQYMESALIGGMANAISFGLGPINGEIAKGTVSQIVRSIGYEGMKDFTYNLVTGGIISWFSTFTNRIISTMLSTPVEPSLPVISIS